MFPFIFALYASISWGSPHVSEYLGQAFVVIESRPDFKFIGNESIGTATLESKKKLAAVAAAGNDINKLSKFYAYMMTRASIGNKDLVFLHKWNKNSGKSIITDAIELPTLHKEEYPMGGNCHFLGKTSDQTERPLPELIPLAIYNGSKVGTVTARRAWRLNLKKDIFEEVTSKVVCEVEWLED